MILCPAWFQRTLIFHKGVIPPQLRAKFVHTEFP